MTDEQKITFFKDEYLLLQKFYEDFDNRLMTIKGWSATIGLAAIGAGFYQTEYLWLFAAGAALVFWTLEAVWKSFQYFYAPRLQALEKAFADNNFTGLVPFQIYSSWFEAFRPKGFQIIQRFFQGIVMFPHAIITLVGLLLFVLETSGIMHLPRRAP